MVETIQTYTLMHKDIPVAEIRLDSVTASVSAVGEIFTPAHVPVGIPVKKGKIDRAAFNEWWTGRAIPASLDRMLVLDYLIMNEDRHQNNFGAVRNANTLEWIGATPVYDSGTSLWFDKPTMMIGSTHRVSGKPFKNSHDEQIKLVSSFDWLNLNALAGIDEELRELTKGSLFIDEARTQALCKALCGRVDRLTEVVNNRPNLYPADDRAADVPEDVAYSGDEFTRK